MNVEQQLAALRDVWIRTGYLSDLQVLQLKMWALCIFPKVKKSSETHIDKDTWTVEFHLVPEFLASFSVPKDAAARCAYVEKWVHLLLDGRVLVRVFYGKNLIFEGTRTAPVDPKFLGSDFADGAVVPEIPWTPKKNVKY